MCIVYLMLRATGLLRVLEIKGEGDFSNIRVQEYESLPKITYKLPILTYCITQYKYKVEKKLLNIFIVPFMCI